MYPKVPSSLGVLNWHRSVWEANICQSFSSFFVFHFVSPCLNGEGRGISVSLNTAFPIRKSSEIKMTQTKAGAQMSANVEKVSRGCDERKGTGTVMSGFDASLKHCSECGGVISLTIPPPFLSSIITYAV